MSDFLHVSFQLSSNLETKNRLGDILNDLKQGSAYCIGASREKQFPRIQFQEEFITLE